MSLLLEIQNSAVNADEPIGSLLRRCKILAARLGSSDFKSWVESELNGYSEEDNLPEYRIMNTPCKGNFSGGYGSGMNGAEIPRSCIPEEYRSGLFTSYFLQPISSIESLIKDSDGGTVQEPWPSDVTMHFGLKIYSGMNCLQAWKVIPVNALVGMLDVIRNKVLSFVLELESEDPKAGDVPSDSQSVPEEKVQQFFHTYISGNVQNVATGSTNVKQRVTNNGQSEMFNKLLNALNSTNESEESKGQIIGVVEEMRDTQGTDEFRDNYNNFMSFLADHIQVYGPVVAPYLPTLSAIIP